MLIVVRLPHKHGKYPQKWQIPLWIVFTEYSFIDSNKSTKTMVMSKRTRTAEVGRGALWDEIPTNADEIRLWMPGWYELGSKLNLDKF